MKIVMLEADSVGRDMDFSIFEKFGEFVKYSDTTDEELPSRVADVDVIITNKTLMNASTLEAAKNLKLICVTATGYNNLDGEYLKSRGIAAYNVAGYSTNAVAQHTFAMMFYVLEKLRYYDDYVKSGAYARGTSFSHFEESFCEINGKTWGIIGMGAIGKKVAQIATAFGCRVICYSPSGGAYQTPYEQVDFDTLLSESDLLSIHTPLNNYTEGLMNLEAFRKMKRTAILINAARGPIVKEQDLLTALNENLIEGAALDVLSVEPMQEDNPLRHYQDSKRLLITPHIGWAPAETRSRVLEEVAKNIQAFLDGESRNRIY